ncbi:unnamed protein product [Orchesella dallaii]|uniref:RING-type domain-containing protein n=1 Tax=Orchesella dallaii TaxID=48710 RepID=A0ABP1RM06_9HEXA
MEESNVDKLIARVNDISEDDLNSFESDMKEDVETGIELVKASTCKVCWMKEASFAMLPCGHLSYCLECITCQTKCVICRKNTLAIVKLYKS